MALRSPARQTYPARAPRISAERLVNLYPETDPQDARSLIALYGTPGLSAFASCGAGPVRCGIAQGDHSYVVSGTEVYRIDSAGAATLCGGSVGIGGPVTMATNGEQTVIVTPPAAFVVVGTGVGQIVDPDFPGATSVTYIDGYFVFSGPEGTGRFFISALLDGTNYDALDFATAEGDPDPLIRVFGDHRELWAFGVNSTEIYSNTGEADFPFTRISGAFIERGCGAVASVAKADNTVFWLGDDRIVYRADGYVPRRVSTFAVEEQIRALAVVSDAVAWTYPQSGHTFYVLTFPTAGRTFAYDMATGLWHERQSGTGETGAWRVAMGWRAFGRTLAADAWSGAVFAVDLDVYTEDGAAIRRVMQTPPLAARETNNRVSVDGYEVVFQAGVGTLTGQGAAPQVALSWSNNDGDTWSSERWRPLGPRGQRYVRAEWWRLGSARSKIVRAVVTDPVPVCVVGFAPMAKELGA